MTRPEWFGIIAILIIVGFVGASLLSGLERAEHRQLGASPRARMLTAVGGLAAVLLILVAVLHWLSPSVPGLAP